MKRGELKGLIATSSLELGIDVGQIDLVIQYMSPSQVTRFIQRVGRAGHTYGHVAEGLIIGMDSDDTLEALSSHAEHSTRIGTSEIPDKPYDVLVHQIAGLMLKNRRLEFYEVLELAQQSRTLREPDFGRHCESFQVHARAFSTVSLGFL